MIERIKNDEQHIAALTALHDTLLPRLISGQLQVQKTGSPHPTDAAIAQG
jgi:hypothetical protein